MTVKQFPSYQVYHLNSSTGEVIQVFPIDRTSSVRFSKVLNGVGQFVASLPDVDGSLFRSFGWDDWLEVYRKHAGKMVREGTYFIRSLNPFIDDDDLQRLVVGGLSLEHLLSRRVINPDDDPNAAGGYSTKAGTADAVMREYALEQIGVSASPLRKIGALSIPLTAGVAPLIGERRRFDNLLKTLQDIAIDRIDFELIREDQGALRLDIKQIGADKTRTTNYPTYEWVGFNILQGNLRSVSLNMNRNDERTYVYVLGEGGSNRPVFEASGPGVADTLFNRIEYTYDARRAESVSELLTAAGTSLSENKMVTDFEFEVNVGVSGGRYRTDWVLGDRVTAYWEDFSQDVRIDRIEFDLSDQGERISVRLANRV